MNIRGKIVLLRAIERQDIPLLHEWSNNPEVQQQLGGWHFPSSLEIMENWFERSTSDGLNQRFAIETADHDLIGTTNLVEINWKDRNAFHGMLIGNRDMRGKGYGVDTVMAIMRYAFEEMGLERLDTTIIEYNQPSYRLYIGKCGWKEEGRKQNWYWRQNRFWDKLIVGINRSDYFAVIQRTNYWEADQRPVSNDLSTKHL